MWGRKVTLFWQIWMVYLGRRFFFYSCCSDLSISVKTKIISNTTSKVLRKIFCYPAGDEHRDFDPKKNNQISRLDWLIILTNVVPVKFDHRIKYVWRTIIRHRQELTTLKHPLKDRIKLFDVTGDIVTPLLLTNLDDDKGNEKESSKQLKEISWERWYRSRQKSQEKMSSYTTRTLTTTSTTNSTTLITNQRRTRLRSTSKTPTINRKAVTTLTVTSPSAVCHDASNHVENKWEWWQNTTMIASQSPLSSGVQWHRSSIKRTESEDDQPKDGKTTSIPAYHWPKHTAKTTTWPDSPLHKTTGNGTAWQTISWHSQPTRPSTTSNVSMSFEPTTTDTKKLTKNRQSQRDAMKTTNRARDEDTLHLHWKMTLLPSTSNDDPATLFYEERSSSTSSHATRTRATSSAKTKLRDTSTSSNRIGIKDPCILVLRTCQTVERTGRVMIIIVILTMFHCSN